MNEKQVNELARNMGEKMSRGMSKIQTPPEPEQAANQEPAQDETGAAPTSITEWQKENDELFKDNHVPPVVMPLGCELPPEPQRVGYTSSQYNEQIKAGYTPEDNDFCWEEACLERGRAWVRQKTVNELKERWAIDIVRQELPNDTKVELFAKLLEIEVA